MSENYPRDLVGYGAQPPHPQWPGGARIAVQFVINYEEGGENCILHGDDASEAFLSDIVGADLRPLLSSFKHLQKLRLRHWALNFGSSRQMNWAILK